MTLFGISISEIPVSEKQYFPSDVRLLSPHNITLFSFLAGERVGSDLSNAAGNQGFFNVSPRELVLPYLLHAISDRGLCLPAGVLV